MRIAVLLAAAPATWAWTAGRSSTAPLTNAELLRPAREALGRGDAADALALLELAAVALPGDAEVEALLGRAHLLAGHPLTALRHVEQAMAAGNGGPKLLLDLGLASWELNRVEVAERAFRDALAAGGGAAADHQLGRLLLWQGRHAEALEHLQTAARSHPADVDLALDLAGALVGVGRSAEALLAYRELARRAPELPGVRYRIARLLLRAGQRAEAAAELTAYRSLLDQQRERLRTEGLTRARLDQAWDLYRRGQTREALSLFAAQPESVESLSGIAYSQSAIGDHAAAALALERAVTLAPERQDLRMALSEERLAAARRP